MSLTLLPRTAWSQPTASVEEKVEPAPASPEPAPIWPVIALGAAGGVGLTVAVVGFILSVSSASDGLAILDEVRDAGERCETEPAACERAQDAFDDEAAFKAMGVSGLVVGAAALSGLAIYQVANRTPSKKKKVAIEPVLGPVTGLWATWSFE